MAMLCLLSVLMPGHLYAMQERSQTCKHMAYENRNQTDYGPLRIVIIRGLVKDGQNIAIPKACVGVFTEAEHKFVAGSETDDAGHFEVKGVPKGEYRLVVKYQGFCSANARVRVQAASRRAKPLVVHMRPAGIDTCSYVDRN